MEAKSTLSVVTITLNEAHTLKRCHQSISWADEWVIVDSGSEDGTVALARRLTEHVHERTFDDFSSQWNYAIDQARCDWVLVLAADEVVSPALRVDIDAILASNNGPSCYAMPRKNLHFGKWLRYGGQYPDLSRRLFRKGSARWEGNIHEQLTHEGQAGRLDGHIVHRSFDSLGDWIQKMDRQTSQEAKFAAERGEVASWFAVTVRPVFWFLRMYVAQRGFLDGWTGLIHSMCTFVCVFFRNAKLRELLEGRGGRRTP